MTTSSYASLSHAKWAGKYHVVFIPEGRKKALYGKIRGFLGPVVRERAGQRGSTILEGHMVQANMYGLCPSRLPSLVCKILTLSVPKLSKQSQKYTSTDAS